MAPAGIAVAGYLAFTIRNAVNVVYWDEWANVRWLRALKGGTLGLSGLWAQHGDNRIVLPRAIDLAVGNWFNLDARVEIFMGVVLLGLAALLIALAQRRVQGGPLYLYAPVALFLFSPVQWQNTLWSFQLAWFLVLALLAAAVYAMCRSRAPLWFGLAIGLAVAASVSSLQGLFVWPAVGLLVWAGGRSRRRMAVWAAVAAVTTAVYFVGFHFDNNSGNPSYALVHPLQSLRYFLVLLGGFSRVSRAHLGVAEGLGVLMLGLAIWVLIRFWRSDRTLTDAVPASLVVYVLLFDVSTLIGRITAGPPQALASRYTTYNLLLFVAVYLSLVDERRWRVPEAWSTRVRVGVAAVGLGLVGVLAVSSVTGARHEGARFAADRRRSVAILRRYRTAPRSSIEAYVCPAVCGRLVPDGAPFLEAHRYSVFRSP